MITSIVELLNVSFMAFSPVCQTCGFAPAIAGGDQDSAALMACIWFGLPFLRQFDWLGVAPDGITLS
jgi:hypothetical protein